MTERLRGKRALVYGGGTGIGLAMAQALHAQGAAVVLSGRREHVLAEAAAGFASAPPVSFAAGDASQPADVERVTEQAVAFLGGLDTIVISAGAGGRTPILDTPPEEFRRIVDNNLMPAFLAPRYGARHIIAAGGGSIIIVSSMYGIVGQAERVAYCGAKHGTNGMVKSMALDLAASGVRVNAVCPGFVETPLAYEVAQRESDPEAALEAKRRMHPIPRAGRLEEMGEIAVYLASDLSAFVTGQSIAVDGGYSTR
ncbi:MAG: SDR family oxidoreductase [Rhizobiaceae bacterium]|nr:SDR family oxidoreductase [Rhizobiaceae bacterium]